MAVLSPKKRGDGRRSGRRGKRARRASTERTCDEEAGRPTESGVGPEGRGNGGKFKIRAGEIGDERRQLVVALSTGVKKYMYVYVHMHRSVLISIDRYICIIHIDMRLHRSL